MGKYSENQRIKTVGLPPNLSFVLKNSYATVIIHFCQHSKVTIPSRLELTVDEAQSKRNTLITVAQELLAMGESPEKISKATKLPLKDIEELIQS